jgi:mRNA interferase HigB
MRVLAWSTLDAYIRENASAEASLKIWFRTSERADWSSFAEVRRTFNSVDSVADRLVFNIGGNNYRLIAKVSYPHRHLWIRWVGTHAEYDRLTEARIREL